MDKKVVHIKISAETLERMRKIAEREGRTQHGNFVFAIEQWGKKQK